MRKKIEVSFVWIDEECARIVCPYCKAELTIDIYPEMDNKSTYNKCVCGKRFVLLQCTWVEELI